MNRIAGRAGIVLLLVLILLAGMIFFLCEYVFTADNWVVFPGSPHVYNGDNIGCGSVQDRDGQLLMDLNGNRTYAEAESLRMSTLHWLGDRKGNISAPALSAFSYHLVGFDLLNGVYEYGGIGGEATLTLSAEVQMAALEAMGDYKGTLGIYNYKTGELLCGLTTPTYDPDHPPVIHDEDEQFEGLYLNRFIQSNYIPGSIFKIVTLAAAIETIPDIQEQTFNCKGSYKIGKQKITCVSAHWKQSLKDAFKNSCNCAFAQIAQQLGNDVLTRYVEQFGVVNSITFDGLTTPKGNFDLSDADDVSLSWSAIGQHTDLVNPCTFMSFVGAIGAGGRVVLPHLVETIHSDGIATYAAETVYGNRIMSTTTAEILTEYMQYTVDNKYGIDNFPGMTVCAKTGTAEVGGGKKPNAMIAGFVKDEQYPLAFVITVEDGGFGQEVCVPILAKVLAACKAVLDR